MKVLTPLSEVGPGGVGPGEVGPGGSDPRGGGWAMMADVPIAAAPTMVGRDAELSELVDLVGLGADGPARSVLVAGDAGVGKTRLLDELAQVATDAGWMVLAGHCLDFGDSALPYLPFSEVLGRLDAEHPDVVDRVATQRPALTRLRPGRRVMDPDRAGAGLHGEGAASDRTALFEGVHAVLEEAALQAPVLLVVEDLHWADQSTRDLLSFLFTRPFVGRVSVVTSCRTDDLHRRHPMRRLVAEWARLPRVARISLGPLPDDAVRALVSALVPAPLPASRMRDLVARAEGNAFFAEELAGATPGLGRAMSTELADLLLMRLDRLEDAARTVVRAASVSGRTVSHDLLRAVSELDDDALDVALRTAVEHNVLVTRSSGYAFRHALLGEAVYDDLLPGERVRLHAACAAALQADGTAGTAAELARHALLAHDLDTALDASIRAGDEALLVGGPDEAAHHYQQALELVGRVREVPAGFDASRLASSAADALVAAGDADRAAALLHEQLKAAGDAAPAEQRARMLSALALATGLSDNPRRDPIEASAEAVELVGEDDSRLRARVLANHAKVLYWYRRIDEARAPAIASLALAERFGMAVVASEATMTLSSLKDSRSVAGLRAALVDAVEQAEQSGALQAELRGRFLLARSHQDAGEFDDAVLWFSSALERAERGRQVWAPYGFESRWQLANVRSLRGEWDEALALTRVRGGSAVLRAILDTVRTPIRQARGEDVSAAITSMRQHWEADGAVVVWGVEADFAMAAAQSDPMRAFEIYDEAVTALTEMWGPDFRARVRLAAQALWAAGEGFAQVPAARRADLLARAAHLRADGERTWVTAREGDCSWGPEGVAWRERLGAEAERMRWLCGAEDVDPDTLVGAWRSTEAAFERLGHVHELARVRIVLARILAATGDRSAAVETAEVALANARALGAVAVVAQACTILGGDLPTGGGPSLTQREREVLALVAQGRSNGEIGKQLFISAKTVSVHVSNILAKLDCSSRTEAVAVARRRGLLG